MSGDEGWLEPLPIRRIGATDEPSLAEHEWPMTLAPVAQLLRDGLVPGRATVVVGENGTGKSTIVEAIAMAYGLGPEGGSVHARQQTWASESPLHRDLRIERGPGASRWGYFVRAETMHGLFTFLDSTQSSRDPAFHRLSHGESFLALLRTGRFDGPGLFVMDEPEAGLSFSAQLALVGSLSDWSRQRGTQVVVATHSPVVASLPGATILELDDDGFHETTWDDLEVVAHHRRFLAAPDRYLRHLFG